MNDRFRILLVDDNPDDRMLIRRALVREFPELEIIEVGDPKSLARALEDGPFDLVITDYGLGFTDGFALLDRLKAQWPECPVILCTGTLSEEIAVEALRKGPRRLCPEGPPALHAAARRGPDRDRPRPAARGGPRGRAALPRALRRRAGRPHPLPARRPHPRRQRGGRPHHGLRERRRAARRERGGSLRGRRRPGAGDRGPRAWRDASRPRDPGPAPGRGPHLGHRERAAGEGRGRPHPALRVEPRRHHGAAAARGPAPPGPEDGGGRAARGRGGPRLQQPAHRDQRALLPDAGASSIPDDALRREVELVRGAAERAAA